MKKTGVLALSLLLWILGGCSNSVLEYESNETGYLDTLSLEGLSFVRAKGMSVTLGTDDPSASVKDRPSTRASFDYNFLIGTHEVTCKEMGLDCGDSLPATDITYYDAILHANARSKAEGFDTAYSYSELKRDEDGSCVSLDGLKFNALVDAYRLPTEAEWVYVASRDWKPEKSWHSGNSDYALHNVCSSYIDGFGFCDMAGNAMEWVFDQWVSFGSVTLENFVGGKSGNGIVERVLKGGSFRNAASAMHVYERGDVYTVTSSTKAAYVGFRLAFGKIPDPMYLDPSGRKVTTGYSVVASSKKVKEHTGLPLSKLVFRDDASGSLVLVDFSGAGAVYREIPTEVSAYHPDISFDGKYVAYCTGLEGVSGPSKVFVSRLDGTGDALELDVESASIPRWRVLENGDTVIVYVTDAGNNKKDSDFFAAQTWQVRFENGKFGTPEKLFDGAYHGGVDVDGHLAVTGARLLRARVRGKDLVWYDGEQACNASLNRTGSGRTLFLDFGKNSDDPDSSYGVHERLLMADSSGEVVGSVISPEGFSFDHSEWAVGVDSVAVATLSNANGSHQKIVLMDPYTGEKFDVVEGDELWHPAFWAAGRNRDFAWDLDSLGQYYTDNGQLTHYLAWKMPVFWEYRDSLEVVCLGNSHMQAGVVVEQMERFAMNMAAVPCDLHCSRYLYENYVSVHAENLKYLVVGIDPDLWGEFDGDGGIWANEGDALGFQYDIGHQYWREGIDESFVQRVKEIAVSLDYPPVVREARGWVYTSCIPDWGSGGTGFAEVLEDSTWSDDPTRYESNLAELDRILDIAELQGILVVGVVFPMSPYYKNTGSYGRHGMRRSTAEKILARVRGIAEARDNFVLMDENKMGDHDYIGDYGSDYDHLCVDGAEKLTSRLSALLDSLAR